MRTRTVLSGIYATVAIVTIGWQADVAATSHPTVAQSPTAAPTAAGTVTDPLPAVTPTPTSTPTPTETPTDDPTPSDSPTATPTPAASPTVAVPAPVAAAPKPAPAAPAPAPAPAPSPVSGTFTGTSVNTVYGAVQVQLVVVSGKITDVGALHLTDYGSQSVQISNSAAPVLRAEVLSSQSARVASVSGATYTSRAYLSSVQSALDQAHL